MDAIDDQVGGFRPRDPRTRRNDTVHHTNYFNQLGVIEAHAGWWSPDPPAAAPSS